MKGCIGEIRLPAAACPPDILYTTRPSHTPPPLWESWHTGLHASQERPNPETNDFTIPIVKHDTTPHIHCVQKASAFAWITICKRSLTNRARLFTLVRGRAVPHSHRAIEHVARIISVNRFFQTERFSDLSSSRSLTFLILIK